MAEPGTTPPERPRTGSPTPRPRERDPVALAAWRRVAEQRRRAGGEDEPPPLGPAGARVAVPDPEQPTPPHGTTRPVPPDPVTAPGPTGSDDDARRPDDTRAPDDTRPSRGEVDLPVPDDEAPGVVDDRDGGDARSLPPAPPGPSWVAASEDARPGSVDGPFPPRSGREAPGTGRAVPPAPPTPPVGPADGPPPPGRLHDVLLGLAGRLDDDALTSVREMVALEDDVEAAELLAGSLVAGDVVVTPAERSVLGAWFAAARVDPELGGRLTIDPRAGSWSGHRFAPAVTGRPPGAPLARAAARLSAVVSVRESWRLTPAGAAPGPLPHRVVLVEAADADDCDHVVHHLTGTARALGGTSLEVFAMAGELPAYHRDALAASRPLGPGVPDDRSDDPADDPADDEAWRTVADAGAARGSTAAVAPPAVPHVDETAWSAGSPVGSGVEPTAPGDTATGGEAIEADLAATARRIAALWARPVPEDFSTPLPPDSLEPAVLEPADPPSSGDPAGPAAPRNGHRLPPPEEPDTLDEPLPVMPRSDEPAQVQRARHSRAGEEATDLPADAPVAGPPAASGGPPPAPGPRSGGVGAGGPVATGSFASFPSSTGPGDAAERPATNGHRHAPPGRDEEPATGPVAWAGGAAGDRPAGPDDTAGLATPGEHPAATAGDVAPPWAATDGTAWRPGADTAPVPWASRGDPESTASWSPPTDEAVSQLSDRERQLLARLHEELAQRERIEGADPFAGPTTSPAPPENRPPGPGPRRGPGHGPPVNGHGLTGGPEGA